MSFSILAAALLLAVLALGCVASILAPKRQASRPPETRVPPYIVAACTLPVAALVFYLASGYTMLSELFAPDAVSVIFVVLQVFLPLAACLVCIVQYFKSGMRLRYFLLFWLNLVLVAVGAGAWGIGRM